MKVRLDWRKKAIENAQDYYSYAKELASKAQGAKAAVEKTLKEMELALAKKQEADASAKEPPKMKRKKAWYEKFRWFFTSGKRLVMAGRDAKQNDILVSKVMGEDDLFFHADVHGAPATILQGGKSASKQEKEEAAQFAASNSSAWKMGYYEVDVYAVSKGQLSKHAHGGYVKSGGFAISGEREWFRSVKLGLAVGVLEGSVVALPLAHPQAKSLPFAVLPGGLPKGDAAKAISRRLSASFEEVVAALPPGGIKVVEGKA